MPSQKVDQCEYPERMIQNMSSKLVFSIKVETFNNIPRKASVIESQINFNN